MNDILKIYAIYNKDTNEKITKILLELSEEELKMKRNMYYDSFFKLYNHIVIASWHYQNAIHNISKNKYNNTLTEHSVLIEKLKDNFKENTFELEKLNSSLIGIIDELSDEDLRIRKKLRIYNGRILYISISEYFIQHITHQIHHQGQFSQLFDELKIDHEFGNIFPFIPDTKN